MVACGVCNLAFSTISSLNLHAKRTHNAEGMQYTEFDYSKYLSKCNECKISFRYIDGLRKHLCTKHGFDAGSISLKFNNEEEFLTWKSDEERSTRAQFHLNQGNRATKYFYCSRSLIKFPKKGELKERKRLPKAQGSMKLAFNCTAAIVKKLEGDGCLGVTYHSSHYGHNDDIHHLHLSKEVRNEIAVKLISGVSTNRILDTYRDNIGTQLKREDLVSRQDIVNVKQAYKVHGNSGVRHSNDAISIEMWIAEYSGNKDNPILFYKAQNKVDNRFREEDFVLGIMNNSQRAMLRKFGSNIVTVDSTHGINGYDFELTTLMVIDDTGEGFPCAFLITNRKDQVVFEVFFKEIREKVGLVRSKVFMSDMAQVFYNAWCIVMGEVDKQLLCSWHVDRAWQTNLGKIRDLQTRRGVYKALKVVQRTASETDLQIRLTNFLRFLKEDDECASFLDYFERNYLKNIEQWAFSYRLGLGINTNMHLESMHKILKHFYLEGKKVRRLDKGVFGLMKMLRDKTVDRISKLSKGKINCHVRTILQHHDKGMRGNFNISEIETGWLVSTGDGENCVGIPSTHDVCCSVRCEPCNVCLSCYECTCLDFLIKSILCQHIHAVVKHRRLGVEASVAIERDDSNESCCSKMFEISTHLQELGEGSKNISALRTIEENIFDAIGEDLGPLNTLYSRFKEGERNILPVSVLTNIRESIKGARQLSTLVSLSPVPLPVVSQEGPKKITPQRKLYSTTKKRKKAKSMSKGSMKEDNQFMKFLDNEIFWINNGSLDHKYY